MNLIKTICQKYVEFALKQAQNGSDAETFDDTFEEFKKDKLFKDLGKIVDKMQKSKPKRDTMAPKKPKSAYIFYCQDARQKIAQEFAEQKKEAPTPKQMMVRIGEMWKRVEQKDRKKYEEMALHDKTRYEEESKAYKPSESEDSGEEVKKAPRKRVEAKDEDKPKRAPTAYAIFTRENSARLKEQGTTVHAEWKKMSDEDKKPYMDRAKNAKVSSTSDSDSEPASNEAKPEVKKEDNPKKARKEASKKLSKAKDDSESETKEDAKPKKGKKTVTAAPTKVEKAPKAVAKPVKKVKDPEPASEEEDEELEDE
jgi:hypothetical protein